MLPVRGGHGHFIRARIFPLSHNGEDPGHAGPHQGKTLKMNGEEEAAAWEVQDTERQGGPGGQRQEMQDGNKGWGPREGFWGPLGEDHRVSQKQSGDSAPKNGFP